MDYKVYSLKERSDLDSQVARLDNESWPLFLQNGDAKSWYKLYEDFSGTVLLFVKEDKLAGVGFSVPVKWNGDKSDIPQSIESVIKRGLELIRRSENPDTLIPVGILVEDSEKRKGLSSIIIKGLKNLASEIKVKRMIVPVRPILKSSYPLQSIFEYSKWKNHDGMAFDPWVRAHEKLGARILEVTDSTLTVKNRILKWSEWTGMEFPFSGKYAVEGALSEVVVDLENDTAIYKDPNIWMQHQL